MHVLVQQDASESGESFINVVGESVAVDVFKEGYEHCSGTNHQVDSAL